MIPQRSEIWLAGCTFCKSSGWHFYYCFLKMITTLISISKHSFFLFFPEQPLAPLRSNQIFLLGNSKHFWQFSLGKVRKASTEGREEEYGSEPHITGECFCTLVELTKDGATCTQAFELCCWTEDRLRPTTADVSHDNRAHWTHLPIL